MAEDMPGQFLSGVLGKVLAVLSRRLPMWRWARRRPRTADEDMPVSWPAVQEAEQNLIREQGGSANGMVGLAFSGGGIRSATFNLGVLQALARLRLLTRLDYLSTVSGGGYIGGWFQAWFYREYFDLRIARLEACPQASQSRNGGAPEGEVAPCAPTAAVAQSLEERVWELERARDASTSQARWPSARRWMSSRPSAAARSLEERVYTLEQNWSCDTSLDREDLARTALEKLETELANHAAPRGCRSIREEPGPIRFLRDYSNYLTPKTGVFSADTWTVVVIYLRNLLLNALVLVLAGSAVLLTVRGLASAHELFAHYLARSDRDAWIVGGCALSSGCVALYFALTSLGRPGGRRDYVLNRVVVPLLLESVLVSTLMNRLAALQQAGSYWTGAIYLTLVVPGLGLVFWLVSPRKLAVLRLATGNAGAWLPLLAFLASLGAGFSGAGLLELVARQLSADEADWPMRSLLGAPLVLCIIAAMLAVQIGITGRGTTEYIREWESRLMAHLLLWTALCLGIGSIALFGERIERYVFNEHVLPWTNGLTLGWVFTTISGLLAARGSERDTMSIARSALITITPHVFCVGSLIYLSIFCNRLQSWLFNTSIASTGRTTSLASQEGAIVLVASGVLFFAFALFLSWRLGVNEFSLHALYRNRLVRCYLGAVRGHDRREDLFTGFDIEDDSVRIDELTGHGAGSQASGVKKTALRPYLLVNATLNLVVGQRLAWQFRRASSFVFSPLFSGYETRSPAKATAASRSSDHAPSPAEAVGVAEDGLFNCGYRRTQDYGGGISLGTAMAISGAALSPNMGARTTPSMAFIMTLFNVRLGWWLGNPRHPKTWKMPGPSFGLVHLMIELLGKAGDTRRHVYLSDGGHFENLGLYELVRRRCRYVIVCDAGEDSALAFSDLGNAIEKCRVDFGIDIEIDVRSLQRDPETGLSKSHCTVGRIRYDNVDQDGSVGTLVYLKSALIGSEPTDVRTYAKANSSFPHQSTTDQWFDESQFESYRTLGEHIAMSVLELDAKNLAQETSMEPFFTRIRQRHLAPARGSERSFSKHCEALAGLYEQLRTDADLSFLDAQFYPEWESLRTKTLRRHSESHQLGGGQAAGRRHSRRAARGSAGDGAATHADPDRAASAAQLRAGFYFSQQLIQLMESVYVDLDLESTHSHPDNRGWMNLFHHWSWSHTFRTTWAVMGTTTGQRFQDFCERNIRLDFGVGGDRVGAISIKTPPSCQLRELPRNAEELDLSERERELVSQIAAQSRADSNRDIWSCFSAELEIRDRRRQASPLAIPIAMGVLRGKTLVFLRTRDHQRKAGLARDVVISLARTGHADACSLGENEKFGTGPSQLELHRYERVYQELMRDELRTKHGDASRAAE
jgi:hypothetical protein